MIAFARWLGPRWTAALGTLVAVALLGGIALQLAYPDAAWRQSAQIALMWLALAGLALALLSRVAPSGRNRVLLAFSPGLALVAMGIVLPELAMFLVGAGIGWIVVAQIIFRSPTSMAYQNAVKHLRRNELPEAIEVMDRLIERQPNEAEHYRFRADLYRLQGALDRARRDYEHAIEHAHYAPGGYLGLAEVHIQQGQFDRAQGFAEQALAREPSGWMAAYNLGLIADRQGDAAEAILYLERALGSHIPDARYRLLSYLWLARAYLRRGQTPAARKQLEGLKKHAGTVDEWRAIFASEQAAPLRALLADDVDLAARLIDGSAQLEALTVPSSEEQAR